MRRWILYCIRYTVAEVPIPFYDFSEGNRAVTKLDWLRKTSDRCPVYCSNSGIQRSTKSLAVIQKYSGALLGQPEDRETANDFVLL